MLDIMNVEMYDANRLVPLLGRYKNSSPVQWIFPHLKFTCNGTLTKWIIRGVPGQAMPCRVELGMWRRDYAHTHITVYERLSTTENNMARITRDGPIFIYELASPIQVQPDDIVGIEIGHSCFPSESIDDVLGLDISGTGSEFVSYRRQIFTLIFSTETMPHDVETDYIPLIEAVVGRLV